MMTVRLSFPALLRLLSVGRWNSLMLMIRRLGRTVGVSAWILCFFGFGLIWKNNDRGRFVVIETYLGMSTEERRV